MPSTKYSQLKEKYTVLRNQNAALQKSNTSLLSQISQLKNNTETYVDPYMISSHAHSLDKTCHPLTSVITSSFEKAKEKRTDFDKHWLKIYNAHSLNENYNLL
jgi:phage shock protein A